MPRTDLHELTKKLTSSQFSLAQKPKLEAIKKNELKSKSSLALNETSKPRSEKVYFLD
jgi:hypothetical protein